MKNYFGSLLFAAVGVITSFVPAHAANQHGSKSEIVNAQVVSVDMNRSHITLKHERIKSINMGAMTMPFKVKDRKMLQPIKPGDKVRFSVEMLDDELLVTRIEGVK